MCTGPSILPFAPAVYYAISESLFVPKRQIKKVNLSVFWRYLCKIKVKENVLHIETETFCVFQYIQQIWFYSEILSGIHTTFKQVHERYSSCACEFKLFFGIRVSYEPSFLEKIISLFPFSSKFFNFIINDSIFGVVSIHNDSGSRIMPLLLVLA